MDEGPKAAPKASSKAAWLARSLLLAGAAAAVVAAFVLAHPAPATPYACPMHPEVRAAAPGACPICSMALERVAAQARDGSEGAARALIVPERELFAVRPRVFSREVRAPARVEATPGGVEIWALLHTDELADAASEEGGTFVGSNEGSGPFAIDPVPAPPTPSDDTTSWVRFRVRETGRVAAPAAGTPGWVSWPARPRTKFVVPDTAIVRGADGPYVLVAKADAPLGVEKRAVKVGKVFLGLGVIVAGLTPGERVVGDGAFTWDAERRLRAAPGAHATGSPPP